MTDDQKKRLLAALGDDAADLNDEQLLSAAVDFLEEATEFNADLSASNATLTTERNDAVTKRDELQAQVTELSAADKTRDTVELSASQKAVHGENAVLKIESLAGKQNWSAATLASVRAKLGGDAINLSASADGEVAQSVSLSTLLDVLAEQPVQSVTPGEKVTTVKLSRESSDDPAPATKSGNPLLDVANSTK